MGIIKKAQVFTKIAWKKPEKNIEYIFNSLLRLPESPVDFQLPRRLRKQNPVQYTFIKRNVYLAKKRKRRNEDDGIFCSCSPAPGSSTVCQKDCHCGMLLSCCSSNCGCGKFCSNKPFQNRVIKKMKVVKTEKCGQGLIAEEDIPQGEFVIEYVGEVIDDETCEKRLWEMKHRGEKNFYLCEVNRDMVIDATYRANKSRYMNHSCQPNTEMQKWRVDGETRIGIFAIRDIKKGEALTYDYQFIQFGKDQECHCGAEACRGKLGSKPNRQKLSSEDDTDVIAHELAAIPPILKAILHEKGIYDIPVGELTKGSCIDHGYYRKTEAHCVGLRVKVWWAEDKRWMKREACVCYLVLIIEFRSFLLCKQPLGAQLWASFAFTAKIQYDDGDIEVLDMKKENWTFVTVCDLQKRL